MPCVWFAESALSGYYRPGAVGGEVCAKQSLARSGCMLSVKLGRTALHECLVLELYRIIEHMAQSLL